MKMNAVIPGRERQRANPETILRSAAGYGFQARRFAAPRTDGREGV
jgi:hypothetical protein